MRSFLRRAGVMLATGLLIFCCSCERHHVGELPEHEHAKKHSDTHATKEPPASSSAARGTPANFLPDKPKP